MKILDGTLGCGGGHVLRTALCISAATGQAVTVERIRADRAQPGLLRHHLSAVEAAASICDAEVQGAELGSQALVFSPGRVRPGEHHLKVGMSRSALLLLDVVLGPLLRAGEGSRVWVYGGTHTPDAPAWAFWSQAWAPLLSVLGAKVEMELASPGFAPAAGGRVAVSVQPAPEGHFRPINIMARGDLVERRAWVELAHLRLDIAERERDVLLDMLGWAEDEVQVRELTGARGPGNTVAVRVQSQNITEVFTCVGTRGLRAELVAERAAHAARRYLASAAPVGRDLAERLALHMALLGQPGSFLTLPPSARLQTTAQILVEQIGAACEMERQEDRLWSVRVGLPSEE
jgi:RNA 3'-terminal phosphate cyclase (ATP)